MKSMTGYGKGHVSHECYQIDVEIKAVNHRFFDGQFKMPRELMGFENELKSKLNEKIKRGRVECFITYSSNGDDHKKLVVHWGLLDQLVNQLNEAEETRYLTNSFNAETLLVGLANNDTYFETIETKDLPPLFKDWLIQAFEEATDHLDECRRVEGEKLKEVLLENLAGFIRQVKLVAQQVPQIEADYRLRLEKRLNKELGDSFDESRVLTELALLIEKGDIQEELDRLAIHVSQAEKLLAEKTPVGRELDFLLQEMNREVNTTGSKSVNIEIKNAVVQMKTLLEKIREQIQNIE